ncbi:DUF3566 domain-containing protein [Candidatus Roizmanbacteria bacterium]|nr:DUF3566 domain-containing protein [Candidatus Roizmanbacteria bacterium]
MKAKHVTLQHVDPFSLGKTVACVYGITGPIVGFGVYVAFSVFMAVTKQVPGDGVGGLDGSRDTTGGVPFLIFGLVFLLYIISGFFMGFVGALVYNWVSKFTGGIRVTVKE